jgi:hypothetical protein
MENAGGRCQSVSTSIQFKIGAKGDQHTNASSISPYHPHPEAQTLLVEGTHYHQEDHAQDKNPLKFAQQKPHL